MGKTSDLFNKISNTKGTSDAKMSTIGYNKRQEQVDLTEIRY